MLRLYYNGNAWTKLKRPSNTKESIKDEKWLNTMKEDFNNDETQCIERLKMKMNVPHQQKIRREESKSVCKAKLVIFEFHQEEGIDYNETSNPVVKF